MGFLSLSPGGSLVLAEGGICLVGNISRFKKDAKDKVQQSMSLPSLPPLDCVISSLLNSAGDGASHPNPPKATGAGGDTATVVATVLHALGLFGPAAKKQSLQQSGCRCGQDTHHACKGHTDC